MRKTFYTFLFLLFAYQISSAQIDLKKSTNLQVGHTQNVNELSWSPDNTKILSHSSPDYSLRLWDVKTGKQIWSVNTGFIQKDLETHTLTTFDWSKDQKLIASGGYNGRLQVWDAENGKLIWMNEAHFRDLDVVKFSPDTKYLVSIGDSDKSKEEIKLWDIETGKLIRKFIGETDNRIFAAVFNDSGSVLTTGSWEGEMSQWNVADGKLISSKKFKPCANLDKNARGFGYSPDLMFFAARCWEKTVVTNTKTGKAFRVLDMISDYDKGVEFSRDNKVLVLTDVGRHTTLNLSTNQVGKIEDYFGSGFTYKLNNDGSLIAEGGGYGAKGIQVSEVTTEKVISRMESHPGIIKSLEFSADGKSFSSGGSDRILRIWDFETKKLLSEFFGHSDDILAIEFAPDGKTVSSKSEKETITWNLQTGERSNKINYLTNENSELKEKVVSPSGNYLLEDLGDDKPFRLTHITEKDTFKEFTGLTQIQGFKFLPNDKEFLTAAYFQPLQLWDVESGKKIQNYDVGYSNDDIITFSPDGKTFLTGGWNQNILHYELESGKLLWSLFPIDQERMQIARLHESRRIKYIIDEAEFEKKADIDNERRKDKVTVKFSHYGIARNLGETYMYEKGEPNLSKIRKVKKDATVAWFTITNTSDLPISVVTTNSYINPKCKDVCNGGEISADYIISFNNGLTTNYGTDVVGGTTLQPNTTVYFNVWLGHINQSKSIYIAYSFEKENVYSNFNRYGTEQIIYIDIKKIP